MALFSGVIGSWGARRQMRNPTTSSQAYQAALPKVPAEPKLALAILTGNYSREEKMAVIDSLRENMACPVVRTESRPFHSLSELRTLPPFFKLLAKQPRNVIDSVWRLWTANGRENIRSLGFMAEAERQLQTISRGYQISRREDALAISANSLQSVVGYSYLGADKPDGAPLEQIYYATGCEIEGLAFAYKFRGE